MIHTSRRVDWRFLLPDPTLGRVAYIGTLDSSHVEALNMFSQSLTIVDGAVLVSDHNSSYDVVVISGLDLQKAAQAASLVKPGGFIYIESLGFFYDFFKRLRKPGVRLMGPQLIFSCDYETLLRKMHFTEIKAHWHWPNFQECTKIIPLNKNAAKYVFLYNRRSLKAQARAVLGRWLLRAGLLNRVVPHFSVIARRAVE